MFLRQFPIAPRAAFGFAIITLLLVLTGLFSLNRMSVINDASTEISQSWLPSVRTIAQINLSLTELRQVQLGHVLATDQSSQQFLETRMREIIAQLEKPKAPTRPASTRAATSSCSTATSRSAKASSPGSTSCSPCPRAVRRRPPPN